MKLSNIKRIASEYELEVWVDGPTVRLKKGRATALVGEMVGAALAVTDGGRRRIISSTPELRRLVEDRLDFDATKTDSRIGFRAGRAG